MTHRVLVTDYAWPTLDVERRILREVDAEVVVAQGGGADEIIALAPEVSAILTCWAQVPAQALEIADRCLIVARYGIGVDNIPVDTATRRGIIVANVPEFCTDEVSDHVVGLILVRARRLVEHIELTQAGRWDAAAAGSMQRLRGSTLGLIGYGRIAQAVARKAQALGLSVVAFTPRLKPGPMPDGVEATDQLADVLARADYLSLHAPATTETLALIGAEELRQLRPTAFLINTSRGSLLDESALAAALERGELAGAALDVLRTEPPPPDHRLMGRPDVYVTPHVAFSSTAAVEDLRIQAASNVAMALRGQRPGTTLNPQVRARIDE